MDRMVDTLFGLRCQNCGEVFMPPKYVCTKCSSANLERFDLSGEGEIHTFTTIRVAPVEFGDQVPYDIAVVKLKEGPKITARLTAEESRKVEMGAPVSFAKKDENGVCWFKLP